MKTNKGYLHPRKKYTVKKINNFTCSVCGKQKSSEELEIDHIKPISDGGNNDFSNLQPICIDCHIKKTANESNNYSKEINNTENLSIHQKLEYLKDFLIENKNYNYAEINFLVLNHPVLSKFNYNSNTLANLFNKLNKTDNKIPKYKEQRDILIYLLRKTSKMTYQELSNLLKDYDVTLSYVQIGNILHKFGEEDNTSKKEEKSEE